MGATADRRIRENERRAWSDERVRLAEKLRSNYQIAGQTREIRRATAHMAVEIQLRLPSTSTVAGAIRYANDD